MSSLGFMLGRLGESCLLVAAADTEALWFAYATSIKTWSNGAACARSIWAFVTEPMAQLWDLMFFWNNDAKWNQNHWLMQVQDIMSNSMWNSRFAPWIFWTCPLRMLLVENSFLGDFQRESLQDLLDEAYLQFRAFCRQRRIPYSQPPFTVKLVSWLLAHYLL